MKTIKSLIALGLIASSGNSIAIENNLIENSLIEISALDLRSLPDKTNLNEIEVKENKKINILEIKEPVPPKFEAGSENIDDMEIF